MSDGSIKIDVALDTKDFQKGVESLGAAAKSGLGTVEKEVSQVNNSIKSQMGEMSKHMSQVSDSMEKIGKGITDVGKKMTVGITTPIVALGTAAIKSSIDFESAFTGVRKTVDATEAQFKSIETGIIEMSKVLPASATEIAAVAEMAGQLGVKAEDILDFTAVMIDLGESTNLRAENAATALAKFSNIAGTSTQDTSKLGSTIVALGNNFATTEADIVDMAMRLVGAGTTAGFTEAQIFGLATALSSVGIESEMGGSAISKVIARMQVAVETSGKLDNILQATGMTLREIQLMASNDSKGFVDMADSMGMTSQELKNLVNAGVDLENFAKVAGMSGEEFRIAFGENGAEALQAFIIGLGATGEAGETAITMLQDMGLTEVRLRDTLLRASNANDIFTESQKMANEAWAENTALGNEAEQRYATLESRIGMLKNQVFALSLSFGELLVPYAEKVMSVVSELVEKFTSLDDEIKGTIIIFAAVAAAIGPVLVVLGQTITAFGSIAGAISFVTGGIAKFMVGVGGVSGALTAILNPVTLVIAAIGLLAAGFIYLWETNEEFQTQMIESWSSIQSNFQSVIESIIGIFDNFVSRLTETEFFAEAETLILGTWQAIQLGLNAIWTAITILVDNVFGGIAEFLQTNSDEISGIITFAWSYIWGFIEPIWKAINAVTVEVFGGIKSFFERWGLEIQAIFSGSFQIIFETIKIYFNQIKGFWDKWGNEITALFTLTLNTIKTAFIFVWNHIQTVVGTAISIISGLIKTSLAIIQGDWSSAWDGIRQVIGAVLGFITETCRDIRGVIEGTFDNILQFLGGIDLDSVGRDLIQGLINGIKGMAGKAFDAVAELGEGIMKKAKDFFIIKSPSRRMADEVGAQIPAGVGVGVKDNASEATEAVEEMADDIIDVATSKTEEFAEIGDDMASSYADSFSTGIQDASVIALGEWTDMYQGMADIAEASGLERIRIEADMLDKQVAELEKRNKEISRAEDIAAKERKIKEAKDGDERLKAQKELNDAIAKQELEALKERQDNLKKQLKEIADAYTEMNNAIVSALKEQYTQQRDSAKESLTAELDMKKDALDKTYEMQKDALEKETKAKKDALEKSYDMQKDALDKQIEAEKNALTKSYEAQKDAFEKQSSAQKGALEKSHEAQKENFEKQTNAQKDALEKSYEMQKSALDKQVEMQKDATAEIIEQYQKEYDAKMKTLDWAESDEVKAIQDQINAIDAMTEAEDRALKVQENQRKLFDLEQKILQAKSDEERLEAQEKYNAEAEKQARESLLLQRKDEKASLKEQIAEIKANYKTQKEIAKEEFEEKKAQAKEEEAFQLETLKKQKEALDTDYKERKKALDDHIKEQKKALEDNYKEQKDVLDNSCKEQKNTLDENYKSQKEALATFQKEELAKVEEQYKALTNKERMEAEARKMMIDGDQQAIINLLNQYTPGWATAGQSAGEAFLNALQGVTPSIESEVNRIMSLINQASNAQVSYGDSGSSNSSYSSDSNSSSSSPESYTVKSGDTLSGIASKYGVSVTALRNENGLRSEDDKKLQIGKTLRIPILHQGGISMKEQLALIDNKEAVAPLSELAKMMESAVITTANKLVSGFTQSIKSVSNTTTNNNDNGIQVAIYNQGTTNEYDSRRMGRETADAIAREMRSRGLNPV